jgi:hypothetical protein
MRNAHRMQRTNHRQFRHISAQEFSWETLRSALAMLSHNRLPSMESHLTSQQLQQASEHIHPAGIFHHVRMEVVRLQLEML